MWVVPPEKERSHDVASEYPDAYSRASSMAGKMSDALDHDPESARELWKQVHQKRQLDQMAGLGDYSEGNIVYKWLLHEGLFDRIRNELGEHIAAWNGPKGFRSWFYIDHELYILDEDYSSHGIVLERFGLDPDDLMNEGVVAGVCWAPNEDTRPIAKIDLYSDFLAMYGYQQPLIDHSKEAIQAAVAW